MTSEPLAIKRYPNRRFYARHASAYVSLPEIEQMIRDGHTVEIRDSQTGEDITRAVLTQIILDRQPEKIALFPKDMLHFIVRSNDMMSNFLRDYFRHSLTYLDYLQRHGPAAANLARPVHWVKAWLDGFVPPKTDDAATPADGAAPASPAASAEPSTAGTDSAVEAMAPAEDAGIDDRIAQLEARIRQLEAMNHSSVSAR